MLSHLSPTVGPSRPPDKPSRPAPDDDRRVDPLRVAIVGLGPKGLFALERLVAHASAVSPEIRIEVDAFEPHPVPGAGPVYDPGQPAHLRMNFAAGQVDMWWPESTAVPPAERRSFVSWCHARGHPSDPADYPPRADVGRYLSDGLAVLLAHAPPNVVVAVRPTRVRAIGRVGGRWEVVADGRPATPYDEVLIATGHDRSWDGALALSWTGPAPLVPAVFPVDRWLSTGQVGPRTTVAIRGFALTFIDAALTLTEGRGGSFEPCPDADRDRSERDGHPSPGVARLRYTPGGDEPAAILPYSRTGRPMLAKPAVDLARTLPGLDGVAAPGRRQISELRGVVRLHRDLLPILAATARAHLRAARADPPAEPAVDAWLERAVTVPSAGDDDPAAELARSLAVGCARASPGLDWALGQTWRSLYPAIVSGFGAHLMPASDWPAFRNLAAELERISFGPPPLNAAKLLALVDAGLVDLTHLRGHLTTVAGQTVIRSERSERPVDVVVDAVISGPGARPGQNAVLDRLIRDGHARIATGRRGIDVGSDGSCRRADGSLTPGLAVIGRPTEDAVIGNDTLSRTLHPLPDRWARRIVERAHRRTPVDAG